MAEAMSGISTHVLDLHLGKPVQGLSVRLERGTGDSARVLAIEVTDDAGRCRYHALAEEFEPDTYRLIFDTGRYFSERKAPSIYPEISITFRMLKGEANYHLPLLLSANGFTTYRGS